VGNELLAGLIKEETAQLIGGSGIGANLTGLLTTSGILTVGSAGTDLDGIAAGSLAIRARASHCDPDVVVMHPADWVSAGFPAREGHVGAVPRGRSGDRRQALTLGRAGDLE